MAYHIKYTSKDLFYTKASTKFNTWLAEIPFVKSSVNRLATTPGFRGQAADSAKLYFSEVHGLLLQGIEQAITDFYCRLGLFTYGYYDIDSDHAADLPEKAFDAVKKSVAAEEKYINDCSSEISAALRSISDLLRLSLPPTGNVLGAMGELKRRIDTLDSDISSYEKTKKGEASGELAQLISALSTAISSYTNCNTGITGYQGGAAGMDPVMQDLSQHITASSERVSDYIEKINGYVDAIGPYTAGKGWDDLIPPRIEGVHDVPGRTYITTADRLRNGEISEFTAAMMGEVGSTTVTGSGVSAKDDKSVKVAALYGQKDVTYNVFGMDVVDHYYGDLLGASAGYDTDFGWKLAMDDNRNFDWKNSELKMGINGNAEAHVAVGEVSTTSDYLGALAGGKFLTAGAEGEAGVSFIDNGKFAPSVYAGVSGKAAVAEGEVEGRLGTEDNNVHLSGEGTVLGAEAKAEAGAGKITVKDKNSGKEVEGYGVKAEVGAEAYLAEGRVEGGFSLFGVEINMGLEGKAGGVGANAGGYAMSSGVSGELDLGLGLGVGVDFSIDWSGFKWPWE